MRFPVPTWRPRRRQELRQHAGTRGHAIRRLRLLVGASLLCLSLPLGLLLSRVYHQLAREVFYQYRAAAEEMTQQFNQRLADILHTEEQRPFDEYSFLKVATNPLRRGPGVVTSPLSEVPPQSAVPGVLGYFQINPDGSFHAPVLPELDAAALSANVQRFGFGESEFAKRLALRNRLEALLLAGTPVTERRRRQKNGGQPAPVPPFAASSSASQDMFESKKTVGNAQNAPAEPGTESDASATRALSDTVNTPAPAAANSTAAAPPTRLSKAKVPPYRERRKEQVTLPEQSTVSQVQEALDSLSAVPQEPPRANGRRDEGRSRGGVEQEASKRPRAVSILTFEGELDPFQFMSLSTSHLVLFRKAWRDNLRYIQGFVVEKDDFLQHVIATPLSGTTLAQLAVVTVSSQAQVLFRWPPEASAASAASEFPPPAPAAHLRQPLYRGTLDAPLDTVEVLFSIGALPRSPGAMVVDALALTLVVVFLAGHYGLYRLGLQQIALATQRSDFVAAVSHELKTPLTAIRMYGEMLRAGWVQDDTRRQTYYDFIFFESERLSRLITNVLQLARLTNHDDPLPLTAYTVHQLLDVVRSKISTQAEAAGFALHFLIDEGAEELAEASILADEDAFVQICINLVDNALKFSANATCKRIDVGVRRVPRQPRHVALFVRDYGPGVARDQVRQIFQLFYRGENALTRQTKGTGIGLALVKALATKMHAQVHLHNHTPGAEFQLIFPTLAPASRRT